MQTLPYKIPTLELKPREIHLYFAFPDEIQDVDLLSAYKQLMTPDEQAQQQRFHFAKHRHQYLITRALVRTTLSRYADIEPHQWRFSKNDYGRPEIVPQKGIPPLRFNLSHTDSLIVCAVVLKQDIGVDVENMERKGAMVDIADRFFSQNEVKDLYALPENEKRARFFDYWTLKESYIKARGMGLSLPLDQFSFHIDKNKPLAISFEPRLQDDPDKWQLWLLKVSQYHKVALSVCRDINMDYQLVMKKVVPLMGEQAFFCSVINNN
jgi:4'-phosphopantetheinyl transferase